MAYQSSIRSYARRSYGTQTRGGRVRKPSYTRRSVFRKTVATGKVAIGSLQRQVTRLRRMVTNQKDEVQYKLSWNDSVGNAAGTNCYTLPLMKFSNWTRVFGASTEDETPNDCLIKKTNIDVEIDNNGERNNIDYTIYIVSLTRAGTQELLNVANGTMNTPLVENVHYVRNAASNGMTFLNKKFFNVLWARRPMTGIYSGLTTEPQGLRKRYYTKFLWNKGKGIKHVNPQGNWNAKPCPSTAGGNVFMLIFNNDSTVDAAVQFRLTAIHTLEV